MALRLRESSGPRNKPRRRCATSSTEEKARRKSKEAAGRELEQRYGTEIQALKSQLGEKEESLRSRGDEIKSLKTQVASLAEQLTKVGSAKERAASLLQQKLKAEKQKNYRQTIPRYGSSKPVLRPRSARWSNNWRPSRILSAIAIPK